MLIGAHAVIFSTNPDADRAFLRDIFKLPNIDGGGGYVIFGLPPSEIAVHQRDNDVHELYFMCADVEAFIGELKNHNVSCSPVSDEGWGLLTRVTLPGGGQLGVYQPRHARPAAMAATKTSAKRVAKRAVKRGRKATKKTRKR
jgi:hypothetical protein